MNLKQQLICMLLIVSTAMSYGQRESDKTINFEGKIEELFFHDFSGIPIVLTDKTVAGVDPESGTKIWEKTGDRISLLGGMVQTDESNYKMVPFSPYIIVSNLLINTKNGDEILDKESMGYKKIKSFEIIPELKSFLFHCTTEDKEVNKLFLVSLDSNSVVWNKDISLKKRGALTRVVANESQKIACVLGNKILIIDAANGSVLAEKEEKIGELYMNPSGDKVYAVEAAGGGLGSMMGAAITLNVNKMVALGEKIWAFNMKDGSEVWKKPIKLDEGFMESFEVDGNMFIRHEKAGNLYDYTTGEPLWKKAYEKRNIDNVEKVAEGYMLYYGARKILLDKNGKKVWKKPQYVGNDFLAEVGEEDTFDEFRYSKGSIVATPYRIAYYEDGAKKAIWKLAVDEDTRIAFDENEKNLLLLDGKKLYLFNPDKGQGKDNVQKLELKKHRDFNLMEIRKDSYFLSSPWEYAIVGKDGKVQKTHYYVQPGEAGRKWLNALSVVGSLAGSAYQMAGLYNASVGATKEGGETIGMLPPGSGGRKQFRKGVNQHQAGVYGQMAAEALYNPNRVNAFKDSKDYAFYFTKSDDATKYLVQVTKDQGKEVDKFTFLDNNPQYHVDEVEKRILYTKGKDLYIFDYQ